MLTSALPLSEIPDQFADVTAPPHCVHSVSILPRLRPSFTQTSFVLLCQPSLRLVFHRLLSSLHLMRPRFLPSLS
jgi:hypothetical protein